MTTVPDASAFAGFEQLGIIGILVSVIFLLLYLLWRAEKRAERLDAVTEGALQTTVQVLDQSKEALTLLREIRTDQRVYHEREKS